MLASLCLAVTLLAPQTINGIKPATDGTVAYAQAFAKRAGDEPETVAKKDFFMIGYFASKAKFMAPLQNTQYTAAIIGVCGTMLGLYDPALRNAIKTPADRISKGKEDYGTFTQAERDAIGKAMTDETTGIYPLTKDQKDRSVLGDYTTGMALGGLSAYVTLWHISPKNATLLEYMKISVESTTEAAEKLTATRPELSTELKAFAKFEGKTLDETAVRAIGKQIEYALRASLPEKYRWTPTVK